MPDIYWFHFLKSDIWLSLSHIRIHLIFCGPKLFEPLWGCSTCTIQLLLQTACNMAPPNLICKLIFGSWSQKYVFSYKCYVSFFLVCKTICMCMPTNTLLVEHRLHQFYLIKYWSMYGFSLTLFLFLLTLLWRYKYTLQHLHLKIKQPLLSFFALFKFVILVTIMKLENTSWQNSTLRQHSVTVLQ